MNLIRIKDNDYRGLTLEKSMKSNSDYEQAYKDLEHIANNPLKSLVDKNQNLLIFPQNLKSSKDRIGDLPILQTSLEDEDYSKVKLYTNNLMGFVGYGNTQISITSRFCNDGGKRLLFTLSSAESI